ncbi:hypothetical protein [Candidatus Nitrosocosmicus arcticus]|uniref:Uncharacterized protein n=1 Tax=Candidatus Nitrosocosmicus arcticus TaxID=2035267 RepID=A0A557SYN9_9ARCH|nr:hypothetical protein [Candidatus Nitrosocosmicus arcticus]TVP41717.1 exported protein of unknown function [Candidatus Nitrosocosmicus arcticus]
MNKKFTLSVFGFLILATSVAYYFQNEFPTVSGTIINAKDQLMPFDMKEMLGTGQDQNDTINNSSNVVADGNLNKLTDCEMPPCPPGKACIQSCP